MAYHDIAFLRFLLYKFSTSQSQYAYVVYGKFSKIYI